MGLHDLFYGKLHLLQVFWCWQGRQPYTEGRNSLRSIRSIKKWGQSAKTSASARCRKCVLGGGGGALWKMNKEGSASTMLLNVTCNYWKVRLRHMLFPSDIFCLCRKMAHVFGSWDRETRRQTLITSCFLHSQEMWKGIHVILFTLLCTGKRPCRLFIACSVAITHTVDLSQSLSEHMTVYQGPVFHRFVSLLRLWEYGKLGGTPDQQISHIKIKSRDQ
jgi:hypothetical protein